MKKDDFWGEPISVYLSEDAELNGILIRVFDQNINYLTVGVYNRCIEPFLDEEKTNEADLISKLVSSVKREAIKIQKTKGLDWFYDVSARGWRLFLVQNDTGKYTLMFPEEY